MNGMVRSEQLERDNAQIAYAVRVAVEAEREACARISDVKVEKPWPETAIEAAREIAARIRARGVKS